MPLIIPTPEQADRLKRVNSGLAEYKKMGSAKDLVAASVAALQDDPFRVKFAASRVGKPPLAGPKDLMDVLWAYLYYHLYRRDYVSAAFVLWGSETFTPEPWCVQLMFDALFKERMIAIIGGGGLGKTYVPTAWILMDWMLDPEWTRIQIASNTEDHLMRNLYADLVRLHGEAALPLPGQVDAESVSLNKKRGMGIFVLTIPGGPQSAGKIKGAHTKARPEHPIFGTRSRTVMLIDEAQEVAQNIFSEIPNRFSTVGPGDIEHIKFIITANPKDPYSPFGQTLKPKNGWQSISIADRTWRSEKGWWVVSLNAMEHENVVARKEIYKGFVTYEGTQNWLNDSSGDPEHPSMYTYVYGKFPPQGTTRAVVAANDLRKSEREWIFDGPTENYAFADWAFTGD
ncbi:MAG TPA: hypothetical protein VMQ76_14115, partial [Terracidiphilus sp.]|nr:hypothetical protein [Terracidiphilus sp.]